MVPKPKGRRVVDPMPGKREQISKMNGPAGSKKEGRKSSSCGCDFESNRQRESEREFQE